jgi:hypothetical protein
MQRTLPFAVWTNSHCSAYSRLIGKLQPGYGKYKVSKIPFMQMENIARFLEGAQKAGVPQHDLFQTVDLFEDKNRMQVVDAIWSLSRHAYKNGAVTSVSLNGCHWKENDESQYSRSSLSVLVPSLLISMKSSFHPKCCKEETLHGTLFNMDITRVQIR